jgi:hypothetical protein
MCKGFERLLANVADLSLDVPSASTIIHEFITKVRPSDL